MKRQEVSAKNVPENVELQGWLSKWVNYLKGYQKRYFVLSNGVLTYYRNQSEVGRPVRGSISLQGAFIHADPESKCLVLSSAGSQTFHLKAANESERQKWTSALELARVRAIKAAESEEEEDIKFDTDCGGDFDQTDLKNTLNVLQSKLDAVLTCQDLITKHGNNLQKSVSDLEQLHSQSDIEAKVKSINERTNLFRLTTTTMINACNELAALAQSQGKKWQRLLQHERDHRLRLQEQLEQLARQHSALERAALKETKELNKFLPRSPAMSDDEVEVFEDAAEEFFEQVGYTVYQDAEDEKKEGMHRTPSQISSTEVDDDDVVEEAKMEKAKAAKLLSGQIVRRSDSIGEREVFKVRGRAKSLRQRRRSIPYKPGGSVNLWSIMKNSIGKELSKIPMPVNFNEPLSMLQRLTEDFEYSHILDSALEIKDSCEQMCYVAAFTVSSYSTTTNRSGKPFNPLLFETYECDRLDDLGWKTICEQVSHHPPAAAQFTQGKGWAMWQEFTMSSKFRGKYLSIVPLGISHLEFKNTGNTYTWRKVTTTVHNIIVGKLWVDNHGEMTIENHKTGDKCHLKYIPYSYFSRDTQRKVTGVVTDSKGAVRWVLEGTWDEFMECSEVVSANERNGGNKPPVFETLPPKIIWKKNMALPGCEKFYYFTELALELNESEPNVAPTDSRLRPDLRLMEEGKFEEANKEKVRLEEKQRSARKQRESEAEKALSDGRPYKDLEPVWFVKQKDPLSDNVIHIYNGQYWDCKKHQNWKTCPDIY